MDTAAVKTGAARSAALAGVFGTLLACAAPARLTFYAPFDDGLNAAVAAGDPRAHDNAGRGSLETRVGRGDVWGGALFVPLDDRKRVARYAAGGNARPDRGTIAFFARIDRFGKHWQEHRFVVIGRDAYKHGLVLGVHPQGPHLVFSWCYNQATGWFHAGELLEEGQWHYIAATWEPAAKGEIRFSVFVDGKRRGGTDKAEAMRQWTGDLFVGTAPNAAYALDGAIDDLRIYDAPLADADMVVPERPLSADEIAAANAALAAVPGTDPAQHDADGLPHVRGNVVRNGDFEDWRDDRPAHWDTGAGVYAPETAYCVNGRTALRMQTDRMQRTRWLHSTVRQDLTLRPNTAYRLTFRTAKDGTGDVRAGIRPLRDDKAAGDAVLTFTSGWGWFFHWSRVERAFRTGPETHYRLTFTQYGGPDRSVFIDAVDVRETGDGAATATMDEAVRGFLAFTQSPMQPSDTDSAPAADACLAATDTLEAVTAAGEREPVFLGIHALRHLDGVTVEADAPLRTAAGEELGASAIDIRTVASPLLRRTVPRFIERSTNAAWWLTVDAGDAAPGLYRGSVRVVVAGKRAAVVQLRVNVLPWTWPAATAAFFVYHAETYVPEEYLTPELVNAYYRDMVEHGMTTVTVYGTPDVDGTRVDFARNYKAPADKRPAMSALGYDLRVPALLQAGLCADAQPLILLISKVGEYGFGGQNERVTRALLAEWSTRGWPTPLLYVHDEPSLPERIAAVKPVLETIKSWKLDVKTVTSGLDIEQLGHLYDVWIQADAKITHETVSRARELNAQVWTYNCNTPCSNAAFARVLCGFWAHRTGIGGVGQWAYYDRRNWFVDADGTVHGSGGLSRVCVSADGPVPTLAWEGTREGTEDYRCALAYEQRLDRVRRRAKAYREAAEALLSPDDIKTIRAREAALGRKHKPDEPVPEWTADDDAQKQRGEKLLLDALALQLEVDVAAKVRSRVLRSIPFDAMAVRGSFGCGADKGAFTPPIDADDPVTAPERKRAVLTAGIARIDAALARYNTP